MKLMIANAFALSMLDREAQNGAPAGYTPHSGEPVGPARIPRPVGDPSGLISEHEAFEVPVVSVVGHADTAAVFSTVLGRDVPYNRATIKLADGDHLLVGQYIGPRLPEGATSLPEGATIEWWIV